MLLFNGKKIVLSAISRSMNKKKKVEIILCKDELRAKLKSASTKSLDDI